MFESISRFAADWRAARARRRTEIMLEALPPELQRDVGYSGSRAASSRRRMAG